MIEEIKRKSGKSFRVVIYDARGRRKRKSFRTITLAKEWERRVLRERDEQEASGIIVDDAVSVAAFASRWMKEKVSVFLSDSTNVNYERILRVHILPEMGSTLLKDIRVDDANRLVSKLKSAGHVPKGINLILGVLVALLNDAVGWQCLARNPLFRYKPVKEPELHFDYWSASEVQQFLNASVSDPYQPLYVAALNTGMRRGELCGLKWDRVDLLRKQIVVSRSLSRFGLKETTKSGRKRYVPINPVLCVLLEALSLKRTSDFVFAEADGAPLDVHHMYRDFGISQDQAGFGRRIRFHDLRHTFASHFMMNGGNIYDLQKILGHSSLEMTQRYAHMSPDHLAQAIQIVSFAPKDLGENVISLGEERRKLAVVR
jgi:integrase